MPDFHLPLSGNVTQTINPWTWFFNPVGNQVSLVSVNLGSSGDPQAEEQILEDVGSYGRQIGRIGDALRVLIAHVPLDNLSAAERTAIDALSAQLDAVDKSKAKRGS
jgi:hypothetical protein